MSSHAQSPLDVLVPDLSLAMFKQVEYHELELIRQIGTGGYAKVHGRTYRRTNACFFFFLHFDVWMMVSGLQRKLERRGRSSQAADPARRRYSLSLFSLCRFVLFSCSLSPNVDVCIEVNRITD
jgi:hypothetical protein